MQTDLDRSHLTVISDESSLQIHRPQSLPQTYYSSPSNEEDDDLTLQGLLTTIRRRSVLILGITLAVTGATWLWTSFETPLYKGGFQVLVEPPTQGSSTTESLLLNVPEAVGKPLGNSSTFDYDTQIQVLRSPTFLTPIVERLTEKYPELTYKDLLANLNIEQLKETSILAVNYTAANREEIQDVLETLSKEYLAYSFEQRKTSLNQGIQFVNDQLPELQDRVNTLQQELERFRQEYSLTSPESRGQELSGLIAAIEQQQQETTVELGAAQSLYSALQEKLGSQPRQVMTAVSVSESKRYQDLLVQIQEVETKLAAERTRFQDEAPVIQALQEQRQNLLTLLKQEAGRLGAPESASPSASGELNSIEIDLSQKLIETENQIQVLKVRGKALGDAEKQLKQEFDQIPNLDRRYTDLQRELGVATSSLDRFLKTREQLQIEAAQQAIPWEIIAEASSGEHPVSPRLPTNIGLGALAGLMLGFGAALLAEKLDNVFHTPEDLKLAIHLPILGTIPRTKDLEGTVAMGPSINGQVNGHSLAQNNKNGYKALPANGQANEPTHRPAKGKAVRSDLLTSGAPEQAYKGSIALESFRSLHTNLRFLGGSDTPVRSLVLSSAVPGDGKSTVSTNLALAAAAMGQRVLLVDADLRRPQVHVRFGIPNIQGLSNAIVTDVDPSQLIQRISLDDELFVLTAGQLPPDPTKLLSSRKMFSLMERFKSEYDLVIYDTPPVLGFADAQLIAARTDGLALVVGLGRTDISAVTQALDSMKTSNLTILGVVANGVKMTGGYGYYYGYYYGHYYSDRD